MLFPINNPHSWPEIVAILLIKENRRHHTGKGNHIENVREDQRLYTKRRVKNENRL